MRFALFALALLASACATESSDPSAASSTEGTSDELASEPAAASASDCLVGTWQIDPASMDLDKIPAMQEMPDAEFSVGASSGRALLAFEADGDAMQTFEDFSITINADVMGMQMSVRNDYSGTAAAIYAVEGDRIAMTPGEATLSSAVSVNGGAARPNPFATESIFEEWERGRSAFTCDGDELMLTIHAPDSDGGEAFIRDVRYTRVAG